MLRRVTNGPDAGIGSDTIDVYLENRKEGNYQIRYFEPENWSEEEMAQVEHILLPRLGRYPELYFLLRKRHVEREGKVRNYHASFDFPKKDATVKISTEDLTSFLRQIEEYCPL